MEDGHVVNALPGSVAAPESPVTYESAEQHLKACVVVEHAGELQPEVVTLSANELMRFEKGTDIAIMLHVQRHKSHAHAELRRMLLDTGMRRIVDRAPWDANWGTGHDGKGFNKLGVCLMALRAELREGGFK